MDTPQYVRLPERLTSGNVTDLESGWHIGGFDVKTVPNKDEHPVAHNFVMSRLRAGHLEVAGQQEHDTVQQSRRDMTEMHLGHLDLGDALERPGHQEQPLQDLGASTRRKLAQLRSVDPQDQLGAYEEPVTGYKQEIGGSEGMSSSDLTPTGGKKTASDSKTETKEDSGTK